MHTISRVAFAVIILGLFTVGRSADSGPPPGAGHGRGPAGAEMVALERFLSLPDAELAAMQDAIARVRAMSPEERATLLARIRQFRQLPTGQRAQIRAGWGWNSEQDRADWRRMMRGKTPDERAAIQTELQSLPAERRADRKTELLDAWRDANRKK